MFASLETKRQALKYIAYNTTLAPRQRAEAHLALVSMPVSSQPTKIKNRCTVGGRGRGVLREFKMARVSKVMVARYRMMVDIRANIELLKHSFRSVWQQWRVNCLVLSGPRGSATS